MNEDLLTDDEITREQAMADGPTRVCGIDLKPITALTVSWMQRNDIFSENMDLIWKSAAFAFIHSEPTSKIRAVVNNRSAFIEAVDSWIEKHIVHHDEITAVSDAMNLAFQRYKSSSSEGTKGSAAGN